MNNNETFHDLVLVSIPLLSLNPLKLKIKYVLDYERLAHANVQ